MIIKMTPTHIKRIPLNNARHSNIIKNENAVSFSARKTEKRLLKMVLENLPPEIQNFIKALMEAKSPIQVIKSLENVFVTNKEIKKMDLTTYRFKDYKIDSLITNYAEKQSQNIKIANKLGLKSAPIFVKHAKNSIGESLLVTKINGLQTADYQSLAKLSKVDKSSLKNISTDMEKLAENGYVMNNLRSGENILVDTKSKKTLIPDWLSLKKAESSDEIKEFVNGIKNVISSKE